MKKQLLSREMVEEKICHNTYQSLKSLVENCYYAQATIPSSDGENLIKSYCREFCTVRLQTARRSGHTIALCKIAHEYFHKALILAPNNNMSQRIRRSFPNVCGVVGSVRNLDHVIRVDNAEEYYFGTTNSMDHLRGFEFEAVLVDCAFMLSKKKEDSIYDNFAPSMARYPERFFIFVE